MVSSPNETIIDNVSDHLQPVPSAKDSRSPSPFPEKETERNLSFLKPERSKISKTFNPCLILENSGSVARDHLASERTFLAYVRTSLTVASTGVALVQLLTISVDASNRGSLNLEPASKSMRKYAKPLGATMVIFSIIVLIIGLTRYFTIQHALTLNQFPVARTLVLATTVVLGVLVIITFAILLSST